MIASWLARLAAPRAALLVLATLAVALVLFERQLIGLLPVSLLLALLAATLAACTLRRWRTLRPATLLIHLGVLVILAGGWLSSRGFVATKNIYAGDAERSFFRWDLGQESDLGFTILVTGVQTEYYPTKVRIGVLRDGRKLRLIEMRTGERAAVAEDIVLVVQRLDPVARTATFAVLDRNGATRAILDQDEPFAGYAFRLVAFQTPRLRQVRARLRLLPGDGPPAVGQVAINQPLAWQGMQISLTNFAHDPAGRPYIGLQISHDPGRRVVYAGFILLSGGILVGLVRQRRPA